MPTVSVLCVCVCVWCFACACTLCLSQASTSKHNQICRYSMHAVPCMRASAHACTRAHACMHACNTHEYNGRERRGTDVLGCSHTFLGEDVNRGRKCNTKITLGSPQSKRVVPSKGPPRRTPTPRLTLCGATRDEERDTDSLHSAQHFLLWGECGRSEFQRHPHSPQATPCPPDCSGNFPPDCSGRIFKVFRFQKHATRAVTRMQATKKVQQCSTTTAA